MEEVKSDSNKVEEWQEILSIPDHCELHKYYTHALIKVVTAEQCPGELLDVITEYANHGYRIGQKVDVQDTLHKWCVAEIIEIAKNSVKVHYIGWTAKWDTWIEIGGRFGIAPVFSRTAQCEAKPIVCNSEYKRNVVKQMVEFGFAEDKALKVFEKYGRKQDAWNELLTEMYINKWN
jgi:hypothetical protein